MRQLDGLRALAVIMVMWAHWASPEYRSFSGVDPGFLGVQIFFVLSGFLISGILLDVLPDAPAGSWKRHADPQFSLAISAMEFT